MTVHLFEERDPPYCANHGLRKCASNQSKGVKKYVTECELNFYIYDFLKFHCSEEKLLTLSVKLIEPFSKCSFFLTKWVSNSNKIIKSSPKSESLQTVTKGLSGGI